MRKRKVGIVISNKPQKTVIVEIVNYTRHPFYKKYIRKSTKVYAHGEKSDYKIGDRVLIEETKPLSKLKRWRVIRKVS